MRRLPLVLCSAAICSASVFSQGIPPALTAGMGVRYASMRDVVALANATGGGTVRLGEFHAGIEFILHASYPLGEDWGVALDYGYQVTSLSVPTTYGVAEFTVTRHAPTVLLKRVLAAEDLFYLTAGAGIGYHSGTLRREHLYLDNRYSSSGPAFLLLVEGNTSLGGESFAFLALTADWELAGALRDENGQGPGPAAGESTLRQIGVGARLGLTFAF